MSNMSYCRFVNTYGDLQECFDALTDGDELSEAETEYAIKLVELCGWIAEDANNGTFTVLDKESSK